MVTVEMVQKIKKLTEESRGKEKSKTPSVERPTLLMELVFICSTRSGGKEEVTGKAK